MLKIVSGCINLQVHYHEYVTNDIQFFQIEALEKLNNLSKNPKVFFTDWLLDWGDLFHHLNFLNKDNSVFWSDLGTKFHTKFLILANIFSLGNLYTNVIFYNVLYFLGQLCLFKTFYQQQPHKKYLFLVVIFCVPSVLFWCSGLHKDGWVLAAIGFLCYAIQLYLNDKNRNRIFLILIAIFFMLLIRYFYFFCILPPLFIWLFSAKIKNKISVYAISYFIFFSLFFTINNLVPSFNPMKMISNKQQEFIHLRGYSDMETPIIENHFNSYAHNLPTALNHIFLSPKYSNETPVKYKIASLDTYFVFIIIVLCCAFIKKHNLRYSFYWFALFFSVSVYLFIGYTIPNCGALVRYKSEFTAILLPALIGLSEIPFLRRFYHFN